MWILRAYRHFGMTVMGIQVTRTSFRSDDLIQVKLKYIETTDLVQAFYLICLKRPSSVF